MIRIAGSVRRSYLFPAPLDATFRFHSDLDRVLTLLPHIAVVAAPAPAERRLCYRAVEAGLYDVRIHCTVLAEVDARRHRITIRPCDDPAPASSGLRSTSSHGRYESEIAFRSEGGATRIDYTLKLAAALPTPTSLRLVPAGLLDARAGRRFRDRLDEILDGFVRRSIEAYRRLAARTSNG